MNLHDNSTGRWRGWMQWNFDVICSVTLMQTYRIYQHKCIVHLNKTAEKAALQMRCPSWRRVSLACFPRRPPNNYECVWSFRKESMILLQQIRRCVLHKEETIEVADLTNTSRKNLSQGKRGFWEVALPVTETKLLAQNEASKSRQNKKKMIDPSTQVLKLFCKKVLLECSPESCKYLGGLRADTSQS